MMSRLVKWAAAGVLALVPAIGFARSHAASVPGSLSVTPVKAVSSKHVTRKTSSHRKATVKKHTKRSQVHAKKNAAHSKKNTRTASKRNTRTASKSRRSTSHRKTRRA